jgi:guanyl-specific ribonuclease Sa
MEAFTAGTMRRHLRNPWVWVAAALLFALWLFWPRTVNSPAPGEAPPSASAPAAAGGGGAVELARNDAPALPAFLPAEARETVVLIQRGGPYPHPQDGSVFQNRERHLPDMPRGYYHEYTVDTPGLDHRGARRIVTGGQPPSTWYYTDDHYDSFRSFDVAGSTQ